MQDGVERAFVRVERDVAGQPAAFRERLGAQHAQRRDAHPSGLDDADRTPRAAGVERGIGRIPVPEHAGHRPLGGAVTLRRARDLQREHVFARGAQRIGDLERVRDEVSLSGAEVLAVEPDVAVVEDAVELDEGAPLGGGRRGGEPATVEHRTVGRRELVDGAPVMGETDGGPRAVVELPVCELLRQLSVARMRAPGSRQVHAGNVMSQVWAGAAPESTDIHSPA